MANLKEAAKRKLKGAKKKVKGVASDLYNAVEGDILGGNKIRNQKRIMNDELTAKIKKMKEDGVWEEYSAAVRKKLGKNNKYSKLYFGGK